MLKAELEILKKRIVPYSELEYLFCEMNKELKIKKDNEILSRDLNEPSEIVKNILNDIISDVIINDLKKKINKYDK